MQFEFPATIKNEFAGIVIIFSTYKVNDFFLK